jgi:hypothetical protein
MIGGETPQPLGIACQQAPAMRTRTTLLHSRGLHAGAAVF